MARQRAGIDIRLGARIKALRIQKGFTQKSLAAYLGVSHQQIQKYENGRDKINLERLTRLRTLFGVTWDALLDQDHSIKAIPMTKNHRMVLTLFNAFANIPSDATKRHLVDLVKLIAEDKRKTPRFHRARTWKAKVLSRS